MDDCYDLCCKLFFTKAKHTSIYKFISTKAPFLLGLIKFLCLFLVIGHLFLLAKFIANVANVVVEHNLSDTGRRRRVVLTHTLPSSISAPYRLVVGGSHNSSYQQHRIRA